LIYDEFMSISSVAQYPTIQEKQLLMNHQLPKQYQYLFKLQKMFGNIETHYFILIKVSTSSSTVKSLSVKFAIASHSDNWTPVVQLTHSLFFNFPSRIYYFPCFFQIYLSFLNNCYHYLEMYRGTEKSSTGEN